MNPGSNISAAQVKELRERTGAGMMDCRKALDATAGDLNAAIEKLRMDGQAKAVKKAARIAADGTIAIAAGKDAVAIIEVNCETDFVAKGDDFQAFAAAAARAALEQKPGTIEQLAACKAGAQSLEEMRKVMVAKIGENITLRRFEVVKSAGGPIGQYLHAGNRIGVVVALSQGDAELARDIGMHVAASRPQYLKPDDVPQAAREDERKVLMAQAADSGKPPEIVAKMVDGRLRKFLGEISLLGQPFVKDPDQTVEKILQVRKGAVARFVRFEVGEGIEKKESDFAAEVMATVKGQ
jgi:elongation factor Ts